MALCCTLNDRWGSAQALGSLGWIAQESGALDAAHRLGSDCLALHQALGDQKRVAGSLADLGFLAYLQGRSKESETLLRDSVAAYRGLEDLAEAYSLLLLGLFPLAREAHSNARKLLKDSAAIYRKHVHHHQHAQRSTR